MATPDPYPLLLEPILLEKVWGGSRLCRYGKRCPEGKRIGESWELADLGVTAPSGGGGGAVRSRIASGPLAGRTLHEAAELWGAELLGTARPTPEGGFPLLLKYLDASENLSVQVHPSAAYAAVHAGCHVKTECWYILEAAPGSVIYRGVKPGVTRERLEESIRHGTVVEHLIAAPAVAGECHTLPSGVCHALGAGVLVAEVQTPSDTTFRLFDWGRTGRELHIQQALECITFEPPPEATRRREGHAWGCLARTRYFDVFEYWAKAGVSGSREYRASNRPTVLMVLEGSIRIGGLEAGVGSTVLVPARSEAPLNAAGGTKLLVTVIKGSRVVAPDLAGG